jgi:hypothetical protein
MKATQNSAGSYSLSAGASKTFIVTDDCLSATARMVNGGPTHYTVSVDGGLATTLFHSAILLDLMLRGGRPPE